MKTSFALVAAVLFLVALWMTLLPARANAEGAGAKSAEAADYRITGPAVHDNLAVYLLHGKDTLGGKIYLTLQEALDQKVVIVHETGEVNELSIENVSPDKDVFVQSGDIVKGGRQDRTIAQDFICAPKSGKLPINAFCVESGRWHQRAGESAASFASSENAVAGKSLKLAAKASGNQSEVWQQVAQNQSKLSENSGQSVADPRSASSYELTLENKKVEETIQGYLKALQKIPDGEADVIGYAFAINGKVNSAEVYGSHDLFTKLWPKLIKSSAVEAFAERQKGKTFDAPSVDAVKACIDDVAKGKSDKQDTTARVQLIRQETKENVLFETHDQKAAPAAWVHRSYLTKDEPGQRAPAIRQRRSSQDSNAVNSDPRHDRQQSGQQQLEQQRPAQPPAKTEQKQEQQ